MRLFLIPFLLIVLMASSPVSAGARKAGRTRKDRDRLIRLEAVLRTFSILGTFVRGGNPIPQRPPPRGPHEPTFNRKFVRKDFAAAPHGSDGGPGRGLGGSVPVL
jgi:hypothetical protein